MMRGDWDPRRERRELLAEVNRAFRVARQQEAAATAEVVRLPADFVAYTDRYEVLVDLPGVKREDLDVQVERGALTLRGKKAAASSAEERVLRRERQYGQFARLLPLPDDADLGQVAATLTHGELRLTIARRVEAGPRRIEVVEG
jgi:HSP20 family protein